MKNLLVLLTLSTMFTGCASMGASKYGCGAPDGVSCRSIREVYAATDGPGMPAKTPGAEAPATAEAALDAAAAGLVPPASQRPQPMPSEAAVIPWRTQPQVMRVWIAPYVDGRGDLHAGSRVFMEIEPKRWAVGDVGLTARALPTPLQVRDGANGELATGVPPAAGGQPTGLVQGSGSTSQPRNRALTRRAP